jgi:hypothetical protein
LLAVRIWKEPMLRQMLFSKLATYGIRLVLSLILGLALVTFLPPRVEAQQPIDLVVSGEGATGWNIDKIKPGDSGIKTVELRNASSKNGSVTIWITGINETDYAGDGAALSDYLFFNLSCSRLNTNIILPTRIRELPQNASDPNYIKITPINADEIISLTWRWEFRETGKPQNDAQGDSLSFTINYLLQELPSRGGGEVEPASTPILTPTSSPPLTPPAPSPPPLTLTTTPTSPPLMSSQPTTTLTPIPMPVNYSLIGEVTAAVTIIGLAIFFLWRRRRHTKQERAS